MRYLLMLALALPLARIQAQTQAQQADSVIYATHEAAEVQIADRKSVV